MDAVVVFAGIFVFLLILRLYIIKSFKRTAVNQVLHDSKFYKVNGRIVQTESWFVFLVAANVLLALFLTHKYQAEHKSLASLFSFIVIASLPLSALLSLPVLQRYSAYFNWGNEEIEYNLSFTTQLQNTIKIHINDIAKIDQNDISFILYLRNGRNLIIKKNLLQLLYGWGTLQDKFCELSETLSRQNS